MFRGEPLSSIMNSERMPLKGHGRGHALKRHGAEHALERAWHGRGLTPGGHRLHLLFRLIRPTGPIV